MAVFPGGATPPDPPGIRIGVIGVGMIGQDHIRRITQVRANQPKAAQGEPMPLVL